MQNGIILHKECDWYTVLYNVLVWWKLQVSWCYCVAYIRFSPFLIFYISQGVIGKMTNVLLRIPCWIQWWQKCKNRPTFGKVINEKCRRSLCVSKFKIFTFDQSVWTIKSNMCVCLIFWSTQYTEYDCTDYRIPSYRPLLRVSVHVKIRYVLAENFIVFAIMQ